MTTDMKIAAFVAVSFFLCGIVVTAMSGVLN